MGWQEFGRRLNAARQAIGIANQTELAALLGVRQQTVSRWEQGLSRPRAGQIPEIASALRCDTGELLSAAGYAPKSAPQATFDQPWPIDALSPTSFERFCTYFLESLYPEADVHRYGDQGHKQHGLDIEAIFPDGRVSTFQCKRHAAFGPKKVDDAVKAHTRKATQKVILLSSVASTQARDAIKKYSDWELWDREDISRLIRQDLPKAKQRTLVDVFFSGQHRTLTGELDASPWYTPDAFFAPTLQINRAFSHSWELVGREAELDELFRFADESSQPVALLVANGGSGKSRLLKAVADRIAGARLPLDIYFLSRDALTTKSLDELGPRPKLLICDDAHEREDLGLLFDYAADPSRHARLVISLRHYGMERIKRQARAVSGSEITCVYLPKMSQADSEALALQALKRFGGNQSHAGRLAAYTRDCPLATVIGAEVLSTSKVLPPEFLLSEETFRAELLSRLVESIVEGVSKGLNASAVRITLAAISLLQPIKDEDPALIDALASIAGLKSNEIAQITRRLREAGVLFQRGFSSRIAPDLLADFVVEEECISRTGLSTGFAESVFDAVPAAYVEHILANLGRLDWIKSSGDTRQSRLLDALWERVLTDSEHTSAYLRAAAAVAFYQPNQALNFAARLIRAGQEKESAAKIIRNAAYNYECLPKACQLLWEMGQHDPRSLGRNPSHPIRILAELASPEPSKPIAYIECVVDFAISLIPMDSSWESPYTPLDIMVSALATEGHTTSSTQREMRMNAFLVSGVNMTPVRKKVINTCIELLFHSNISRGYRAAGLLESALRFPMGLFNMAVSSEGRDQWVDEFCCTLKSINDQLETRETSPVVFNRLAHAVSWHAKYFDGATTQLAKKAMTRQKDSLHSKAINFLMSGWGRVIGEVGDEYSIEKRDAILREFTGQILHAYPDPSKLRSFIEDCLREIAGAKEDSPNSPFGLVTHIIWSSSGFAKALVEDACLRSDSLTQPFAGLALARLLSDDATYAVDVVASNLTIDDTVGMQMVAEAYARYRPNDRYSETDIRALKQIVTSNSKRIALHGADSIGLVASVDRKLAAELLALANLSIDSDVADHYLMWLCNTNAISVDEITQGQLQSILHQLTQLDRLDSYWIQEFLGKAIRYKTELMIEFFKSRVERALESESWYQPIPYSSFRHGSFGLTTLPDSKSWLDYIFGWARTRSDDVPFRYQFSYLIEGLCAPFNDDFFSYLENFIDSGKSSDLELVMTILRETAHTFVFERETFVIRFLRRAKSFGFEFMERAVNALYASAIGGVRTGVPGKPFPRDLAVRDSAEAVLSRIGRFEPAYELYEALLNDAKAEIKQQERIGQAMDEEEE